MSAATFAVTIALWFVMMVAMMMPPLLPWIRVFGKMAPAAYPSRRPGRVLALFVGGYFAIWLVYSTAAAGLQVLLHSVSPTAMDLRVGAPAGGLLLIGAGVFQLTPLKEACLAHCRNPLTFFLANWDGGPASPFRIGARHGIICVGCCWALMLLSFALGVMNLMWMAALTAMIVAEQRAPKSWRLDRVFGVTLAMWGTAMIVLA